MEANEKPWVLKKGPLRRSRFGNAYSWLGSKREHWAKILIKLEREFEGEWFRWRHAVAACPVLEDIHPKEMRNLGWIEKQKKWVPGGYWRLTRSARTFAQDEYDSHDERV